MNKTVKAGLCGAGAIALLTAGLAPAYADPSPVGTTASNGDIVGVGSDTVQYGDDFVADGTTLQPGYNSFNPAHRIASFDATNPYILTAGTLSGLTGDPIKLRGGGGTGTTGANANIIARPPNSGGGLALIDTAESSNSKIDFARSSTQPSGYTTAQQANLTLHAFADDHIQVAVAASGTNAPSTLTTDVLRRIYEPTAADSITTWGQVPGYSGPDPSATITPILPPVGSGTRNTFLTDVLGSKTAPVSSAVVLSEEHDPSDFVDPPTINGVLVSAANEIAPFSTARVTLFNTGYFNYLSPLFKNSVTLLAGVDTAPGDAYENTRHLYNVTRDSAASASWVAAAFGPSGFFCGSAGQTLAGNAGLDTLSGGATCG